MIEITFINEDLYDKIAISIENIIENEGRRGVGRSGGPEVGRSGGPDVRRSGGREVGSREVPVPSPRRHHS